VDSGHVNRKLQLNRVSFGLTLAALAGGVFVTVDQGSRPRLPNQEHRSPMQFQTLDNLVPARSEIGSADIASMNLLCAEGLSNAENLLLANALATLDEWASHIKSETERHLYRFKRCLPSMRIPKAISES
jgi:hypothetical protein